MKAVILAGGYGTRISEESSVIPKPMIEIGGYPILWHIMKIYSHYGVDDFIICGGYKVDRIREYFSNYYLYTSDVTFDFSNNGCMTVHSNRSEKWKVTVVDTGLDTMTGGRIKRIAPYVNGERFFLTYGDGVSDVDLNALLRTHEEKKALCTLTAVRLEARFGMLQIDTNDAITAFKEKPKSDHDWINGGFFVCEPEVFGYINSDSTVWEKEPLEELAKIGKLFSYKHNGFWQPMDTLREKKLLDNLYVTGQAPWKLW